MLAVALEISATFAIQSQLGILRFFPFLSFGITFLPPEEAVECFKNLIYEVAEIIGATLVGNIRNNETFFLENICVLLIYLNVDYNGNSNNRCGVDATNIITSFTTIIGN